MLTMLQSKKLLYNFLLGLVKLANNFRPICFLVAPPCDWIFAQINFWFLQEKIVTALTTGTAEMLTIILTAVESCLYSEQQVQSIIYLDPHQIAFQLKGLLVTYSQKEIHGLAQPLGLAMKPKAWSTLRPSAA